MDELVGNTDGFADSGYVEHLGAILFSQAHILPQC